MHRHPATEVSLVDLAAARPASAAGAPVGRLAGSDAVTVGAIDSATAGVARAGAVAGADLVRVGGHHARHVVEVPGADRPPLGTLGVVDQERAG